jgi:hypothetical protein
VRLRRCALPGGRRVPLRRELPLLPLPSGTGSAFKAFAGIERDKLTVTEGDELLMVFGEDDLNDTRCAECGSLLYSVVREGGWVHVAMGSLVDDPSIRPSEHIYVGSKAPWFEITDDLTQNERL